MLMWASCWLRDCFNLWTLWIETICVSTGCSCWELLWFWQLLLFYWWNWWNCHSNSCDLSIPSSFCLFFCTWTSILNSLLPAKCAMLCELNPVVQEAQKVAWEEMRARNKQVVCCSCSSNLQCSFSHRLSSRLSSFLSWLQICRVEWSLWRMDGSQKDCSFLKMELWQNSKQAPSQNQTSDDAMASSFLICRKHHIWYSMKQKRKDLCRFSSATKYVSRNQS